MKHKLKETQNAFEQTWKEFREVRQEVNRMRVIEGRRLNDKMANIRLNLNLKAKQYRQDHAKDASLVHSLLEKTIMVKTHQYSSKCYG